MDLKDMPDRVFLDTCAVNFILDYGEQVHEGVASPTDANERVTRDIEALYNIFLAGQRAMWQIAISPHTYQEVAGAEDPQRRHHLETWFGDLLQHWQDIIHENDDLPNFIEVEDLRVRILASGALDALPDIDDRVLLCDAIVYMNIDVDTFMRISYDI